jgi:hypothetical protein
MNATSLKRFHELASVIILFIALTPGVIISLPPEGSKLTTAVVHGIIFSIIWMFIYRIINNIYEGFENVIGPCGNDLDCEPNNTKKRCVDNRCTE